MPAPCVLLVDDRLEYASCLCREFRDLLADGFDVHHVVNAAAAARALEEAHFDAALVAVVLA